MEFQKLSANTSVYIAGASFCTAKKELGYGILKYLVEAEGRVTSQFKAEVFKRRSIYFVNPEDFSVTILT